MRCKVVYNRKNMHQFSHKIKVLKKGLETLLAWGNFSSNLTLLRMPSNPPEVCLVPHHLSQSTTRTRVCV